MLVDSHCHLDYLKRDGRDLDEVVAAAVRSDIGTLVTICTKVSEFDTIREIAEAHERVWCSVGIHPHEAEGEPAVDAARDEPDARALEADQGAREVDPREPGAHLAAGAAQRSALAGPKRDRRGPVDEDADGALGGFHTDL